MSVTLSTSQPDKSKLVNFVQELNRLAMFVALFGFQPVKSSVVRAEQLANI
jgi:hypothetical protein